MLKSCLGLAAYAPLRLHHAMGVVLGWLSYLLSPTYAQRLRENLAHSGLCTSPRQYNALLHQNIAEIGKGLVELIVVWFRPVEAARRLVTGCTTLHVVEEAEQLARGIIYVTPHLGCFDIAALYLAQRKPITVLYRPPKKPWLHDLVRAGRERDRISLAPTDLHGVRLLLKALKRGESIGILPDQAPGAGEGEWADFFGRPAYTMTLLGRLVASTGAPVVIACAERLPKSAGYHLHFDRLPSLATGREGARQLNRAVEEAVRRNPAQYLWSYNRYKAPPGVASFTQ